MPQVTVFPHMCVSTCKLESGYVFVFGFWVIYARSVLCVQVTCRHHILLRFIKDVTNSIGVLTAENKNKHKDVEETTERFM